MLLLVEPILALALPIAAAVFWTAEPRRFTRTAFAHVALMAGVFSAYLVMKGLKRVWTPELWLVALIGLAVFAGAYAAMPGSGTVPEPSSLVLAVVALLGLMAYGQRQRR